MAEEEGFEPSHTVTCLRAFQARPFSLLGIPPAEQYFACASYIITKKIINAPIICSRMLLCKSFLFLIKKMDLLWRSM